MTIAASSQSYDHGSGTWQLALNFDDCNIAESHDHHSPTITMVGMHHAAFQQEKSMGKQKEVANGDRVTIWDLLNSSNLDCNNCHCKSTWPLDIML